MSYIRPKLLYAGIINGIVTGEQILRDAYRGWVIYNFFAIKLDEMIEGIPQELMIKSYKSPYLRIDDKVNIKGKILKKRVRKWDLPFIYIKAKNIYNKTLQNGVFEISNLLFKKKILYKGIINGTVSGKQRRVHYGDFPGFFNCFSIKLDEKIEGIPHELIVRSYYFPYLRIGDKVKINGEIVEKIAKKLDLPSFYIYTRNIYNLTLKNGF